MLSEPYSIASTRIDQQSDRPLYRQIYDALRKDVLAGLAAPGRRIAATRQIASELGVSRNTVLEAIEQLISEGYLESRVGSGTFVSKTLPEDLLQVSLPAPDTAAAEPLPLSRRGERLTRWSSPADERERCPFEIGRPALDRFPWRLWQRLRAQVARSLEPDAFDYSMGAGHLPLRRALARYLYAARGLRCAPEQIIIVGGSQQGMDLAGRVLLDPGDPVWIEDPGYGGARAAFESAGARPVPVPVDEEGLQVEVGERSAGDARLAYVTPSHQFPLGTTLSLSRRLALLRWARQNGAWILEDDYDSEYRFQGRPLASLASLDGGRHVVYLGTLSKVMFPGLRLGYLVVPHAAVDAFVAARYATDRHSPIFEQAIATAFFDGGHFGRHIRRMRRLYERRQGVLQRAMEDQLGYEIELQPSATGLHTVGWLRRDRDDREIAQNAAECGVRVSPLSSYCLDRTLPPALLLGYGGFPAADLENASERLAGAFT